MSQDLWKESKDALVAIVPLGGQCPSWWPWWLSHTPENPKSNAGRSASMTLKSQGVLAQGDNTVTRKV